MKTKIRLFSSLFIQDFIFLNYFEFIVVMRGAHELLVSLAYLLNCRFISSRYKGDLSELQRSPLPVSMSNLSLNKNDTLLNHKVNKARLVAL